MKFKKTALLAAFVFLFIGLVYLLDYKNSEKTENQKDVDSQILKFNEDQINMIEIQKKDEKIVLHKSENGWSLLEPIQDKADNDQIEDLIRSFSHEKWLATAYESENLSATDLAEYGLDQPLATYLFKNNLGQSKKIAIGTQKNFEGNSYLRVDSENKVSVANVVWFNKAENKQIYYREKRLYRGFLAEVSRVQVTSLQDHFEIKRVGNNWESDQADTILDQNKVREVLKKISETMIKDYVFDGEPSSALVAEKNLTKAPVHIEFTSKDTVWSVNINIHEVENTVYALTDRPTRLVKLDTTSWELFGNLSLDSLRDRVSLTRFKLEDVKKFYFKYKNFEMNFVKQNDLWSPMNTKSDTFVFDEEQLKKALKKIHDLEISEFIDKKNKTQFKGNEMIILKSESDNLVFQINWGPELKLTKNAQEKEYFYSRTHLSSSIFALEKSRIDSLGLDQILKKKDEKNQ